MSKSENLSVPNEEMISPELAQFVIGEISFAIEKYDCLALNNNQKPKYENLYKLKEEGSQFQSYDQIASHIFHHTDRTRIFPNAKDFPQKYEYKQPKHSARIQNQIARRASVNERSSLRSQIVAEREQSLARAK